METADICYLTYEVDNTRFIAKGTDIPKGDWETELLLVSSKAPAMPGCLQEEGSVLHVGEQHGQRERGCKQACLMGTRSTPSLTVKSPSSLHLLAQSLVWC